DVLHYATSVEGCAWSHSGEVLAVARDDGVVNLLTPRLECLRTVTVSTSAARSVAWTDDDSSFVVGAYYGSLHQFHRRWGADPPDARPPGVAEVGGGVAGDHRGRELLERSAPARRRDGTGDRRPERA